MNPKVRDEPLDSPAKQAALGRELPLWARALLGLVPLTMGVLIIGALVGLVPTDDGAFFAPPWVIGALAAGLILFAGMMWMPGGSRAWMRAFLGLAVLLLVAVVCNWTAFAPGVRYWSETSIGPVGTSGEDPIGGRIVFGLAALVVDAILAFSLFESIRRRLGH